MDDDRSALESQKKELSSISDYWLNEIKSQEDTARQIIALCILMLGASFTLITSNIERISSALNNSAEINFYVYNDIINSNSLLFYKIENVLDFFGFVVGFACFFLVWMLALSSAKKALRIEPITGDIKQYNKFFETIAVTKSTCCQDAITIIMIGSILLAGFIIGIILTGMGRVASWIGTSLMMISNTLLLIFIIFELHFNFQRDIIRPRLIKMHYQLFCILIALFIIYITYLKIFS